MNEIAAAVHSMRRYVVAGFTGRLSSRRAEVLFAPPSRMGRRVKENPPYALNVTLANFIPNIGAS